MQWCDRVWRAEIVRKATLSNRFVTVTAIVLSRLLYVGIGVIFAFVENNKASPKSKELPKSKYEVGVLQHKHNLLSLQNLIVCRVLSIFFAAVANLRSSDESEKFHRFA
jgi:hypothetical protein